MDNKLIDTYLSLSKVFSTNGYHLFLVGGSVRDFLLGIELRDLDLATDATPNEINSFLNVSMRYAQYGSVNYKKDDISVDITTFRKEKGYKDFRHPVNIKFVRKMKTDYKRRDFTINAMYLDDRFHLYDYSTGEKDLKDKVIRLVGNPYKRIKEDPLRILRAIRFSIKYNFVIEEKTKKAMKKYIHLLARINIDKIKSEIKKFNFTDINVFRNIVFEFKLENFFSDVLK